MPELQAAWPAKPDSSVKAGHWRRKKRCWPALEQDVCVGGTSTSSDYLFRPRRTIVSAQLNPNWQGVSIVPACVRNLRSDGVCFYRLQPDDVRVELVTAWKKQSPSVALRAFLEVIYGKLPFIRQRAELH